MRKRSPVNKQHSAKEFRTKVKHTKVINMAPPPTRGGYRL